jgi:hypothetical protein
MSLRNFVASSLLALMLVLFCQVTLAQSETRKTEIGVQATTLLSGRRSDPRVGVGGRLTYNLTNNVAVEGELNYFPDKPSFSELFARGDDRLLGLFGMKTGFRQRHFGLFFKARPGFMLTDKYSFQCSASTTIQCLRGKTQFAMDLGGVVEVYPSQRFLFRVDAGSTLIKLDLYDSGYGPLKGNLQISVGAGYRF